MDKFIYVQTSICKKTTYIDDGYGKLYFIPKELSAFNYTTEYLKFKYNEESNEYIYLDRSNVLWYLSDDFKYVTGYGYWYDYGQICKSCVKTKNIKSKMTKPNKYTLLKKEYIKQKQEIENLEFKIKYTKNYYNELKTKTLEGKI